MARLGDMPSARDATFMSSTVLSGSGRPRRRDDTLRSTRRAVAPLATAARTLSSSASAASCEKMRSRAQRSAAGAVDSGAPLAAGSAAAAAGSGTATRTAMRQNGSGENARIASWRATQKPSVGVWHGP